jgi:hypothetical protein
MSSVLDDLQDLDAGGYTMSNRDRELWWPLAAGAPP